MVQEEEGTTGSWRFPLPISGHSGTSEVGCETVSVPPNDHISMRRGVCGKRKRVLKEDESGEHAVEWVGMEAGWESAGNIADGATYEELLFPVVVNNGIQTENVSVALKGDIPPPPGIIFDKEPGVVIDDDANHRMGGTEENTLNTLAHENFKMTFQSSVLSLAPA